MSLRLEMAEEFEGWLGGLPARDLSAVGAAVIALLDEGADLPPPLVVAAEEVLRAGDPGSALDGSYRHQLGLLQKVRRGVSDIAVASKRLELQITQMESQAEGDAERGRQAAEAGRDELAREYRDRVAALRNQLVELRRRHAEQEREKERAFVAGQRVQAMVDDFRTRKETVKAGFAAARARAGIEEALAEIGGGDDDAAAGDDAASGRDALVVARAAAERLLDGAHEVEEEARRWPGEAVDVRAVERSEVRELRLAALTGRDIRVLFALEAGDTVVLVAGRAGGGRWWDFYDEAIPLARDHLRERRTAATPCGQDDRLPRDEPRAVFVSYTRESFLDAFFPGRAAELTAEAVRLVARNQVQPLIEARRRAGLTRAQVAERMDVRVEQVTAIERAGPGGVEIGMLGGYVRALGGRLEIVADLGAERVVLG